jgi:hypothetical protein
LKCCSRGHCIARFTAARNGAENGGTLSTRSITNVPRTRRKYRWMVDGATVECVNRKTKNPSQT